MNPFSFLEKISKNALKIMFWLIIAIVILSLLPLLFYIGFIMDFSHFGDTNSSNTAWFFILPAGFVMLIAYVIYAVASRKNK